MVRLKTEILERMASDTYAECPEWLKGSDEGMLAAIESGTLRKIEPHHYEY